jgi:hypothetical protein
VDDVRENRNNTVPDRAARELALRELFEGRGCGLPDLPSLVLDLVPIKEVLIRAMDNGDLGAAYRPSQPPSTGRTEPWIKSPAAEAKRTTAPLRSSGSP